MKEGIGREWAFGERKREKERERGRVHPDSKMLRVSLSKRLDLLVLFYLPEKPVDWRRMCQLQLCYVLQDPSSSSSVSLVSFRYVPRFSCIFYFPYSDLFPSRTVSTISLSLVLSFYRTIVQHPLADLLP